FFFFQAEDGIRDFHVTGVQTCALPILFKLSALASTIADNQVTQNFICNNELVNRNKPSPSAKGAIRELLKRMIERSEEPSLGIEIGRASCRERAQTAVVGARLRSNSRR